ncbi:hypothetical protein SNOG_08209 [Parastagonospora nodorum SN15]|uniref:Uncharacterized protein n=1 Tax=Phaeosphaeria nodorum (strain SN15 / ATCC MYA-4574 / FGSC 10173) TaxID=321614 RepID=Q0UJ55_PHANO|nr:hypothetical protein SNOG_08209 [Parastagonospora nodorum SN15]EAT84485.1 hypothetical protein SNOG_08209 [Parastagonospora nodorum SN15]
MRLSSTLVGLFMLARPILAKDPPKMIPGWKCRDYDFKCLDGAQIGYCMDKGWHTSEARVGPYAKIYLDRVGMVYHFFDYWVFQILECTGTDWSVFCVLLVIY